jgi:HEPN domain-containing protein
LASAQRLASGPDPILDTAIYHCQQAAEKALKGFLAFRDHPLEKTHDVRLLVTRASKYTHGFVAWEEAGEILTPYATAYRYPADPIEPDAELYQEAEEAARGVVEYVLSLLPEDCRC